MRDVKTVSCTLFPSPLPNDPLICCVDNNVTCIDNASGKLLRFKSAEPSQVEDVFPALKPETIHVLQDSKSFQGVNGCGGFYFLSTRTEIYSYQYGDPQELEFILDIEDGILAFCANPETRRFMAIVTKTGALLLVTIPDGEVISETELWKPDPNRDDDFDVKICWRHDSMYFAVNFPDDTGKRKIRIFDESGVLFSTSDDSINISSHILSWQPSGGLLATLEKIPSKPHPVVTFLELNGLKRADFDPQINASDDAILSIVWSPSSDILALWTESNHLYLWTRDNYVWMCKKYIKYDSTNGAIRDVFWDIDVPYRLMIIFEKRIAVFQFILGFNASLTKGSGISAWTNGKSVNGTPFGMNCMPPPYGCFQSNEESCVIETFLHPEFDGYYCVIASGQLLKVERDPATNTMKQVASVKLPNSYSNAYHYNWMALNDNTVCCITANSSVQSAESSITVINLTDGTSKTLQLQVPAEKLLTCESDSIMFQSQNGEILSVDLSSGSSFLLSSCVPSCCTEIKSINFSEKDMTIFFGHEPLTRKIYVGCSSYPESTHSVILPNTDCTSLFIFNNNLLVTTVQGTLKIFSPQYLLAFIAQQFEGSAVKIEENEWCYSRKIEKGAQIVQCCLNAMLEPSLVMQIIPRGNLEIIFPRPLMLSSLKSLLSNQDVVYDKIMAALRRHRIDYRALVDEIKKTKDLQDELGHLVRKTRNAHSLVLLITDLNVDAYRDCIVVLKDLLAKEVMSKRTLEDNKEKKHMRELEEAYLAAMAKLGLLENVLKSPLICGAPKDQREAVKARVMFLSYYCEDPNMLFDAALGTYDLNLASLVADCLGKDPKEFLPLLDSYKVLSTHKKLFTIDDRLKKYGKAVFSLIRDESIQRDEVVKYMEKHRLYTNVISFLKENENNSEIKRSSEEIKSLNEEVKSSYGYYLERHGRLKEASILFSSANNFEKAIETYVKTGHWEMAMGLAEKLKYGDDKLDKLKQMIVSTLDDLQDYAGAAQFCDTFINDPAVSLTYYSKAKEWLKCKSLCMRFDLLEGPVKEKLIDCGEEFCSSLAQLEEDVKTKLARLEIVRDKKNSLDFDGEDGGGDFFSDTDSITTASSISGTSVSSSNFSSKTTRSGKNRRKLQKKVYTLKEGSRYEHIALAVHLWSTLEKLIALKADIGKTVEALYHFNENQLAIKLVKQFESALASGDSVIKVVWSTEEAPSGILPYDLLESKYRVPPPMWSTSWEKLVLHEASNKALLG